MSSRFRISTPRQSAPRIGLALLALLTLGDAAPALNNGAPPTADSAPSQVPVTGIFPGGGTPPAPDPHVAIYEGNARYISEGQRLFIWYNCTGCHFHGGGGIGPALMDKPLIYGGRLEQIFASIYQGRPNGMPTWGGKIPDPQIWSLAAYIKSLSAPSAAQVRGSPFVMPAPPPVQDNGK